MGKFFMRNTPLTELEQEIMLAPNFAPRSSSSTILCGYSPHGAVVDSWSCLDFRRQATEPWSVSISPSVCKPKR